MAGARSSPSPRGPKTPSRCSSGSAGLLALRGVTVARGRFREHMEIELVNDGPVTLMLEAPPAPAARAKAGA
jgi:D-Tyr-tRNAtyr deacylase